MSEPIRQPGRIGVFLVDDHELFRRGVRALLDSEPDIEVVGEAETALAALTRMRALRPDVALLDVRLPDGDGITVCREICSALPQTACLMLTAHGDDQALLGAIAERMFLAEKTVKNYVSSLLTKLGMQRRAQATAFAVRHADDLGR